jgi:hypothetical protein
VSARHASLTPFESSSSSSGDTFKARAIFSTVSRLLGTMPQISQAHTVPIETPAYAAST